jgi:hypothetical protein
MSVLIYKFLLPSEHRNLIELEASVQGRATEMISAQVMRKTFFELYSSTSDSKKQLTGISKLEVLNFEK